jgi:hypothetical protein
VQKEEKRKDESTGNGTIFLKLNTIPFIKKLETNGW